jgi:hypothetical protein
MKSVAVATNRWQVKIPERDCGWNKTGGFYWTEDRTPALENRARNLSSRKGPPQNEVEMGNGIQLQTDENKQEKWSRALTCEKETRTEETNEIGWNGNTKNSWGNLGTKTKTRRTTPAQELSTENESNEAQPGSGLWIEEINEHNSGCA